MEHVLINLTTGTVQKQYTSGPLQIARWSNIINCHIFPGPAIITALHSAANDSIAAYTTSVETQISGPERDMSSSGPEEEEDSPIPAGTDSPTTNGSQDGDRLSSDEDDSGEDADEDVAEAQDATPLELDENSLGRRLSSQNNLPDRSGRKLSVVSVTTTLSTKTESISPNPSSPGHGIRPLNSINSRLSSATTPTTDWSASLGAPPMARALLLLAQMSSAGNLMDSAYTDACVTQARANPDFVMGFIAQKSLNSLPGDNFITMTPGVQIGSSGDGLGQQYNSPEKVVGEAGTDVVIVGRGVYGASDRAKAAEEYRVRSWRAYEERIRSKER